MKDVAVVIPVYNEKDTVGVVVQEALRYAAVVIAVDDGSVDGSGEVASSNGAMVIMQSNQGVGRATIVGTLYALSLPEVGKVVCIDSDGQHNPRDIPRLVSKIDSGFDMAIGTRNLCFKSTPLPRWLGNKVLGFVRNFGARYHIKDAESGFRTFSRGALECLNMSTDGFGVCEEVAIKARAIGLKIAEVPIVVAYGDEQSEYPTWVKVIHLVQISWTILKWRWTYEWKPRSR